LLIIGKKNILIVGPNKNQLQPAI